MAQFFGNFFLAVMYVGINFDKEGWALFWVIFSQTHMVTLATEGHS
jgi:hypothetical protein